MFTDSMHTDYITTPSSARRHFLSVIARFTTALQKIRIRLTMSHSSVDTSIINSFVFRCTVRGREGGALDEMEEIGGTVVMGGRGGGTGAKELLDRRRILHFTPTGPKLV
jgi:hypothetical protein